MIEPELYQGDCLEILPKLADDSVNLVLTDPPYGTTACKWDSIIPLEPMWAELKRVTKKNGAVVMTATQPFTTTLIASNMKMFKYTWVWEKEQSHTPLNAAYQPLKVHEDVVVFGSMASTYSRKGTMAYFPQMVEGEPYWRGVRKDGKHKFHSKSIEVPTKRNTGTRFPRSVLRFNREVGLHPTQKPVALMEYLIRTYTNEGDTVLDFTMGSGTTGVAALGLNRKFIGIEKDFKYWQIACDRIDKVMDEMKVAV